MSREAAASSTEPSSSGARDTCSLLAVVLDTVPVALVMVDSDDRVLLWNRAAEEMFGWQAEEVLGRRPPILLGLEEESQDEPRVPLGDRPSTRQETERVRKNGTTVPVSLSTAIVRNAAGEVEGHMAVFLDISERRRREGQLLEIAKGVSAEVGQKFFQFLVQHLALALGVDYAFVGRLIDGPEPAVRTIACWGPTGLAENFSYTLEGTPCSQVIGGRTCVHANGVQARFPRDHILMDMGIEAYGGLPLFGSDDRPLGIMVVLSRRPLANATEVESTLAIFAARAAGELERETTGQTIRESEERYRQLVDMAPLGIAVHHEGRLVFANPEACRQVGAKDSSELLGRAVIDLVHPDEVMESAALTRAMLESGQPSPSHPRRLMGLDGRIVDTEMSAAPLLLNGRTVVQVLSMDVSDRKRAEEALRHAQKMDSIGLLAGGVAHDFNNLLNGILGQCSLALDSLPPGSETHVHIERAVQAAERASDLTRQLLAYAGRGQFDIRLVEVNGLVRQNAHLFQASVPKNVQLVAAVGEGRLLVRADVGHLQQVMMNLILNAAEAIGDRPGTVMIRTDVRTIDEHAVDYQHYTGETLAPGSYICVEVEDDGCGMDARTVARIFEPFFSTKFTGRGLGLAAVQGIVRRHKGGLHVRSTPGVGTLFTVVFPAADSEAVPQHPPAASPYRTAVPRDPSAPAPLILVIDDEPVVRQVARDVLKRAGYRSLCAEDGEAGVRLFRQHRDDISLVLLDLSMPAMGGEETFRELVAIDPTVKVLLSSGFAEDEVSLRFEGMGLAGFIQKPYLPNRLMDAITAAMER